MGAVRSGLFEDDAYQEPRLTYPPYFSPSVLARFSKVLNASFMRLACSGKGDGMNIYVGNLAYGATEEDLTQAFGEFGKVDSVRIIMDRATGRSKGFGFVEMSNAEEGQAAIDGLNDKEIKGRAIRVNEARPKEDTGPRRGGGGYGSRY